MHTRRHPLGDFSEFEFIVLELIFDIEQKSLVLQGRGKSENELFGAILLYEIFEMSEIALVEPIEDHIHPMILPTLFDKRYVPRSLDQTQQLFVP